MYYAIILAALLAGVAALIMLSRKDARNRMLASPNQAPSQRGPGVGTSWEQLRVDMDHDRKQRVG